MPRSVLVPNVKQLTDHYLRQQHGENIVGFTGARIQRGYVIGAIFKSLARIAILLFKRGTKAVGKRALKAATEVGQDVLEGKDVIKSAKLRGKQAVSHMAEAATNKVMVGCGRKEGKKRAAPGKGIKGAAPSSFNELHYYTDVPFPPISLITLNQHHITNLQ